MDLGNKIKEVLHTPSSNEAAKGDVDHRTPGSFPGDDAPTSLDSQQASTDAPTGSERNKLHKSNDPRGWTDDEKRAQSHGYTDSGVGLDSQDPSLGHRRGEEEIDNRVLDTGRDQGKVLEPTAEPSHGAVGTEIPSLASHQAENQSSLPGASGVQLASAAGLQEGETKDVHDNKPSTITGDAPYWGDLPRGAGVYNTVAGHGSSEDDTKRHQAIHSGESKTEPTAVTNLTDAPTDTTEQRSFPLVDETTKKSHISEEQNDSAFKGGATGAATVGAVGAGAYAIGKDDKDVGDRDTKPDTHDTKQDSSQKHSKILGVFHGGSSNDNDNESETKKNTKVHDDNHGKESKLAGIFHRSSDNKHNEHEAKDVSKEDNSSDTRNALGATAGGAGAGGAAAYAASQSHQNDSTTIQDPQSTSQLSDRQNNTTTSSAPSGIQAGDDTRPSSNYPSASIGHDQQTRSNDNSASAVGTTAAGLGVGTLASQGLGHTETESRETSGFAGTDATAVAKDTTTHDESAPNSKLADSANHGQYKTLTSGTPSGVEIGGETHGKQSDLTETRPTHDDNLGVKAAAGLGAAGLGATALSSRPKEETLDKAVEQPTTQSEAHSSTPAGAAVGSTPNTVIHQCHKCGEDNDISAYFTSDSRGVKQ